MAAADPPAKPHAPRAALSLSDFDLARRLGSGAFGEVFLATPRGPIPGVAWPPSPSPEPSTSELDAPAGAPTPRPPAIALKVVDKHLLTRTPGAVAAVRVERDVMDALGALAAAAAAAVEGGGGAGDSPTSPTTTTPAATAAAAALARLPPGLHPLWAATRTVRLLFTFQDAASLYFGLEPCPGGDLFSSVVCAARGPVSPAVALPYLADAVAALAALAAVGVAHRDVKPENFMLDGEGRLKLGDFGCAAWVEAGGRAGGGGGGGGGGGPAYPPASSNHHPLARDVRAPAFVGTADYVPPEALGGLESSSSSDSEHGSSGGSEAGADHHPAAAHHHPRPPPYAADAWALGCVAYQLLVGVPPFRAATEYLTYQRIAAHDLAWPGEDRRQGGGEGGGGGGEAGEGGGEGEAGAGGGAAAPTPLPADAVDLITRLLDPDPSTRLGAGGDGAGGGMGAVMAHPFFAGVDWGAPGGGLAAPPLPPAAPAALEGGAAAGSPPAAPGGEAVSAAEDALDWELASLAAALPVTYSYEAGQVAPPGATGVVPGPPPRAASPAVAAEDWGEG